MPVKHKKKTLKYNHSQDPILYDHFGNPLDDVLRRDKEKEEKKKKELAHVAALVSEAREADGGLVSRKFVVISSNIFLKIDSVDPVLLPAEVGLACVHLHLGPQLHHLHHLHLHHLHLGPQLHIIFTLRWALRGSHWREVLVKRMSSMPFPTLVTSQCKIALFLFIFLPRVFESKFMKTFIWQPKPLPLVLTQAVWVSDKTDPDR